MNIVVLSLLSCVSATAHAGKPAVPTKGNAEGAVAEAVPGPDGTPWIVDLTIEREGVVSHLGKFIRTNFLVVNFLTGELYGTKTFTAAGFDIAERRTSVTDVQGLGSTIHPGTHCP